VDQVFSELLREIKGIAWRRQPGKSATTVSETAYAKCLKGSYIPTSVLPELS